MHIALLNQFFWPDAVATSQLLTEVGRSLGEEHEVTVICAGKGVAPAGSEGNPRPNINILRTHSVGFGYAGLARVASYVTYLAGVLWRSYAMLRPDCVVTLTTPPILPVIGGIIARCRRARHVIWEMDVYPDIASDIGYIKKGGFVERLSGALIDWARRRADAIIVLGDDMKARLVARGIPKHKLCVAENWADGREITPMRFPDGPLTIHYSGNLGLAHEVATITAVIVRLARHPEFRFIFSGGGPRRPALERHCLKHCITNVEFRPYCSNAQLSYSLADGHLGLVTQISKTVGAIVPSKIYGIMAAGRPLLYIGPDGATPARHIQRFACGWRIPPGDVDGVVRLLHYLNVNRHIVEEAGARGRHALVQHFDRPLGVSRILSILLNSKLNRFQSESE